MRFILYILLLSRAFWPADALAQSVDPVLKDIKVRRTLRMGVESIFTGSNPIYYRDARTGEYQGLEIELAKRIARDLGVELKLVPTKWERIPEAIRSGRIDIGLQGLFVPAAHHLAATDAYSIPYMRVGLSVMYRRGAPVPVLSDLGSKTVAILNDPVVMKFVKERNYRKVLIFDTEKELFETVSQRSADLVLFDRPLLTPYVARNADKVVLMSGLVEGTEGNYGILVRKEAKDLLAALNQSIEAWLRDSATKSAYAAADLSLPLPAAQSH